MRWLTSRMPSTVPWVSWQMASIRRVISRWPGWCVQPSCNIGHHGKATALFTGAGGFDRAFSASRLVWSAPWIEPISWLMAL